MAAQRWWLLAAVALAYVQAPFGPLQFDDWATIAVDPGAQSFAAWWSDAGAHVRPMTKLSFALTHALGTVLGNVAIAHHAGSVLIHALAVLALRALVLEFASSCVPEMEPRRAERAAFIAALVFAVHPLATEAVTYLSGRSMALGSLFAFLALHAWIRDRHALAGLFFAAAILSRETMLAALLIVPIWQWARLRQPTPAFSRARLRTMVGFALGACGVAALVGLWLIMSERYSLLLELSGRIAADRVGEPTLTIALGYFAQSLLLLRYPNIDPDVALVLDTGERLVAYACVLGAALVCWRARHRHPEALLALLWSLAFLAPLYLVHVRHDALAERHFYPALAGAALFAGIALSGGGRAALAATAVGVALFALVTLTRNADYRSEVTLWEAAARGAPTKSRVLNNLGAAYLDAERWDEAAEVLQRAVDIDPGHARAVENLLQARERAARSRKLRPARSRRPRTLRTRAHWPMPI